MPDEDQIIAELGLQPHPKGGLYAETWRAHAPTSERPPEMAVPGRELGR